MKNLLLKIVMVLILAILICTGCVQAAVTSGYRFGITAERTDDSGKYVYTFQPSTQGSNLRYIWNVQQYNNGIADNSKVFYCLAQGYGDFGNFTAQAIPNQVPSATGGISSSSYSGPYRLKDTGVVNTLRALYNGKPVVAFNEDKINGLVWILDNMYIPREDNKIDFLKQIPITDDSGTSLGKNVADEMISTDSTDDDLTDFDIEIAQQLAIWKLTNGEEQQNGFPTIYLSINDGILQNYAQSFPKIDEDYDLAYGRLRELYVKMVYNYFLRGANKAQTEKRDITEDTRTTISVYANAAAQPVVTVTREKEITGKYDVVIKKVDDKGNILPGAVFTVNNQDYTVGTDGLVKVASGIKITEENLGTPDIYTIVEKTPPTGYMKYNGTIILTVTKKQSETGNSYMINEATLDNASIATNKVSIDKTTNTITITVVDEPEIREEYIDLALRKFIEKVVNTNGSTVYSEEELENRVPKVNTTDLKNGTALTAQYNHSKKPIQVSVGDKVTYTLRVYNEGNVDAYITEITDYLSKYLKYVENEEWVREYGQSETDRYESKAITTPLTTITGASDNLSDLVGKVIGEGILLPAYDKANDKISYIDVQVTCEILEPHLNDGGIEDYKITNIAEITGMSDKDKNPVEKDIDSWPKDIAIPPEDRIAGLPKTEQEWQEYKDDEIGKKEYIPGQQDDDDFEKVIIVIPKYDLSLRKFIVQVDGRNLVDANKKYIREPIVDTTSLKEGIAERGYGTATYNHPKTPITVRKGGTVTYIIRVYNEGNVDAYVSEITDHLPEYLEFIEDDEINKRFGWKYNKNTREIKTTITSKTNDYSYKIYGERKNGKLLAAYEGGDTLDYIDVAIKCKVSNKTATGNIQTNIAEITEFTDTKGEKVEDLDSEPNKNLIIPPDEELPRYKENEESNPYVPGQEDDDDYEKVKIEGAFDLALRKFITKVDTTNVNNRYPTLSMNESGNIKYTHPKEPVEVCTNDTVIYTIRIYNEGEIAGYANEITDDVPFGLEFLVDNEINKEYRWKMLDEKQQETTDVSKAKYLVTDYLSENQEKETGRNNLIKPFDREAGLSETNPDYRDVQIAFKVTYQVKEVGEESRVLVNVAQISADSDDDIDSKPNRDEVYDDNYHEDDIDYDNVKVKYFDLSLLKWVTRAIVVENGQTRIIESGHTGYENPEPDLKVELKTKDIKKVSVKFAYTIKITNEGEIAGYAKEITDYIPDGLEFKQEDNPEWYVRGDRVVATAQLENQLLQPGETAEVEIILTWVNGENNLGRKVNVAEISKDDNPSKTPDIDSTPDNKVPGEDDIDDAPVLLVIKTGIEVAIKYISLTGIIIAIVGVGAIGIKKFVL